MRMRRSSLFSLFAVLAFTVPGRADPLPTDTPIGKAVDHYLDAKLKEDGITPAPLADDATRIRRLTLDLLGRIPTVAETRAFVESGESDKVEKLVDRLLASSGFVRHQANEFNAMLMAGTRGTIREYLVGAFAENRPWDQMFRELMLPDETNPKLKPASEFLRARITDLDKATSEVSVAFFGVNISCARCHDHPRVEDWKQDHFFGLKAFLARTFDNGGFLAEREYGKLKFKTVKGQDKIAPFMFLTGKVAEGGLVDDPSADAIKKEKETLETLKKNKQPVPMAANSGRAKLVEIALQPDQRSFFARSIVNRLWARLYGYGLVHPLDQMHAANDPSHPELLEWLANDLIAHKYDLKRTMRGLVLSKAYSRSSRWVGEDVPRPNVFAFARVKPMTPQQMAISLRLATTDPATLASDTEKKIEGIEASAMGFASLIEQPGDDFQIGVSEALLFSNGDRIQKEFLVDSADRLVGRLKTINDPTELTEFALRTVLSREAASGEVEALTAYLAKRTDRKVDAIKQLVWALVTSAEFRFNY